MFWGPHASCRIADEDMVACLSARGAHLVEAGIGIVMLNSCSTLGVCRALQSHHSVPLVVGWDAVNVSGQQCTTMVSLVA